MSIKIKDLGILVDESIANLEVHIESKNKYMIMLPMLAKDISRNMEQRIISEIKDRQHDTNKNIDPWFALMNEVNPSKHETEIGAMLNVEYVNKDGEKDFANFPVKLELHETKNIINIIYTKADEVRAEKARRTN